MTMISFNISILSVVHVPMFLTTVIVLIVVLLFSAALLWNVTILRRIRQNRKETKNTVEMIEHAINTTSNNVVRYVLRDDFIYNLYGDFLPGEGLSVAEWKKHIHPEDYELTLDYFHQLIDGKQQRIEFYYRWNWNYDEGEPQWGYMHNVSVPEYIEGTNVLQSIISTLWDEAMLVEQEQKEKELTFKYKQIFENSIVGLSFYTPDGWLLDANRIMREICHFDNDETDEFFSAANLFDMPPFSECCDKDNVEELWICTKSVVPERHILDYLEVHMHPICDEEGKVLFLAVSARSISEEREMYLSAKLNDIQIQKANEQIQRFEDELHYMMENVEMQAWRISLDRNCIEFYSGLSVVSRTFTLQQLPMIFVNQEDDFVKELHNPSVAISKPLSHMCQMHPVVSGKASEPQWVQINSIPEYDDDGRLLGSFGIWRNITGLLRKQEQLKRETERANDSGRQKSVFLANMTHEIRTPLNAIVGFSDLLQAVESPEDKREMIRVIHNNCDMLLRLINDILVLSNVDANAMEIVPQEIDAAVAFDSVCQSLAQRVQEPGVEFLKDNPYEVCKTSLDGARINQVITNFVTNAVKYTHQGHIRVGYRVEERQGQQGFYAYCEDTGSGIPKDQCERVFERFVKLNDFIQGTGLGLSICKAIIEKCGGVIGVDSEVDKGSTFWFWVPATVQELKEKQS